MTYTVNVYWLNNQNVETLYITLTPTTFYTQTTYLGNQWIVRNSSGTLIKKFIIGQGKFTNQNTTISVSQI